MKIPFLFGIRERLLAWPKKIFYLAFLGGFVGALLFTILLTILFFGGRAIWRTIDSNPSAPVTTFLSGEESVVDIVKRANPAVVSIVISRNVPVVERYLEEDPFFGFLFPRERRLGTEERQIGGGSGFIVSKDGLVVTNKHVVSVPNATYALFTQDGQKYEMEIVDIDPFFDLAVLRIKSEKNFPYLEFGASETLELGQQVVAIGNALGEFRNSVSVGVVSGLSRSIEATDGTGGSELLEEVIQTDAAINPGNSGGPLLDINGRVIGVNVAVASGVENIGFALPSDVAKEAVRSVTETGRIARPYLGVRFTEVTPLLKETNDLSLDYGALVSSSGNTPAIISGSPAENAGLKDGDIIFEVNGQSLKEKSLSSIIRSMKVGETATLKVRRKDASLSLKAILKEAPRSNE